MNIQFVNIASFLKLMQNNIPYASGWLISYCLKNSELRDNFIFRDIWHERKEIQEYAKEFKNIDIMCVTNYMWNKDYNDILCEQYKKINPRGIVIYGGIEVPEDRETATQYITERPFVDICFVGQSEKHFEELLLNLEKDWYYIPNTFSINHYNVSKLRNSHMDIEIPTPYLDGIFKNLVGNPNSPTNCVLETNRGCPYGCSFCDWGASTRSKIRKFDLDSIYETIDWIWHPSNGMNLCLVIDANFGIFERDHEILEEMVRAKEKYNNKIDVGLSGLVKNNKAEFHKIINKINSELTFDSWPHLKVGIQTHTKDVLHASDRWNVKDDIMTDIFDNAEYPVHTELIVGLPNETPDSWLDTLQKDFDLGVYYSRGYSLSVLPNAPLAQKNYIDKYQIKIKELKIPTEFHNMGQHNSITNPDFISQCQFDNKMHYYRDKKIYECISYTNEELIKMYQYHWWYQVFYNSRTLYYEIKSSSVPLKQQILDFFEYLPNMPFLNSVAQRYRNSIAKVLAPEPVTRLTRYRDFNNIDSGFKCDETVVFFNNREIVAEELKLLYPNLDFSDWTDPYDEDKAYYQGLGDALRNV